jgi:dTDP-4-amino-4,6-dideoxygalactose transaminase
VKVDTIPFFPQQRLSDETADAYAAIVREVVASGDVFPGDNRWTRGFEGSLAAFVGVSYAIATGSGSISLVMALRACELERDAEVITTPFTYAATAFAIIHAGATPRFADITNLSLQLDDAAVLDSGSPQTVGIVPVHLNGNLCLIPEARKEAVRRGWFVIEDAAQRLVRDDGTQLDHRSICLSLGPTKNVMGLIEAGAVLTDSADVASRVRSLRRNGSSGNFVYEDVGYNGVIDAVAAAILDENLPKLDRWNQHRRLVADAYDDGLNSLAEVSVLARDPGGSASKYSFTAHDRRDELVARLSERGVPVDVYYPRPLHLQRPFAHLGYAPGDFPIAEQAAKTIVSLPIHHLIGPTDVDHIINEIRDFYGQ